MGPFTIGQVAERSGFSASALRYYEGIGLVRPVARTGAGYRLYDDTTLARLAFVARAKQLGCTLGEITDLLLVGDEERCGPVQRRFHALVTAKLATTERRRAELATFSGQLRQAAGRLRDAPTDGPCGPECACLADGEDARAASPGAVAPEAGRHEIPIACTLDAVGVADRVATWRGLLVHVTDRATTPDGGLRLALGPATPMDDLLRLVTAEQDCCAFLAFAVTVDTRGLALEVRAPEGAAASSMVDALFGTAA